MTEPPPTGPALLVVLVEDDDALRFALRRRFRKAGFVVVEAADAEVALGLSDEIYALAAVVVTDIVLPKASGRELGLALRARFPSLPIVYMSGYLDGDHFEATGLDPRSRFLEKPFADESLWGVLAELGVSP